MCVDGFKFLTFTQGRNWLVVTKRFYAGKVVINLNSTSGNAAPLLPEGLE